MSSDGHIELPTKPGLGFDLIESEVEKTIEYTEELGGGLYCRRQGLSKGRWIPTPAAFVLARCLDMPVRIAERW